MARLNFLLALVALFTLFMQVELAAISTTATTTDVTVHPGTTSTATTTAVEDNHKDTEVNRPHGEGKSSSANNSAMDTPIEDNHKDTEVNKPKEEGVPSSADDFTLEDTMDYDGEGLPEGNFELEDPQGTSPANPDEFSLSRVKMCRGKCGSNRTCTCRKFGMTCKCNIPGKPCSCIVR